MSLFQFSQEEFLSFFAVLVRFSVLIAVLPLVGDRYVPAPLKIFFAFAITVSLFPALILKGGVRPGEALIWGATAGGIAVTVGLEALFGFVLGYTARLAFDAIHFGSNLMGYFMGFATANIYDSTQESQSQVIAEIQIALAMLVFLTLDGHHLMLSASLGSYETVGLGQAGLSAVFGQKLIAITTQVIRIGLQLAAPMAICLFGVNLLFGILAKAMPQLHVLVLSFAVSALVGFFVMWIGMPEFQGATGVIFEKMGDWMETMMGAMQTS